MDVPVVATKWSWTSTQLDVAFRDVACNDEGTCLGLAVGDNELLLVDLDTGAIDRWTKPEGMDSEMNFGRLEWLGDRFSVVGGIGYTGVVLERTEEGLDLVWRSDESDVCWADDTQPCLIYSPFAALARAGDDTYVLHPDGVLLRGNASGWELLPSAGAALLSSLVGTSDGALFSAAYGAIYRLVDDQWELVQEIPGLELLWTDGAGFFAGASGDTLVTGALGDDFATASVEGALFADIWGASKRAILAVDSEGSVVRYDGESWRRLDLPDAAGHALAAVSGTASGKVVVVGLDGLVLHGVPTAP